MKKSLHLKPPHRAAHAAAVIRSWSVVLLVSAVAAAAQALPATHIAAAAAPPAAVAAQQQQRKQQAHIPTIIANADLVNMVFSVEDKHGAFVPDMNVSDFRVLEDRQPQQIQFFSQEQQLPLTLGLLLDTSPSQASLLPEEQQISDNFFRLVLRPTDLAFVIGFDINTMLLQDLTASVPILSRAVNGAHIGGGDASSYSVEGGLPGPHSTGATHLWDAIYLACHDELAHQAGRKAIVVVTDGGEQGSTYTHQDALDAALASNTAVFAIMAYDRSFGYYRGGGPGQLQKIAESTGGRSINAGSKLAQAYDAIQRELRSQYTLGYRSTFTAHDGSFHRVQIELTPAAAKLHPGAKVRARTGYYADKDKQ
ncbi:MAG: VWA domain-containing protein [Terriglobales bacterium]